MPKKKFPQQLRAKEEKEKEKNATEVSPLQNLFVYLHKFQRKQHTHTFFSSIYFNYPLENILLQLTVKSKRCNVNHKRFFNSLKPIERKIYHFVILFFFGACFMSFFLFIGAGARCCRSVTRTSYIHIPFGC